MIQYQFQIKSIIHHSLIWGMKNDTVCWTAPKSNSTHLQITSEKAPVTNVPMLSLRMSITHSFTIWFIRAVLLSGSWRVNFLMWSILSVRIFWLFNSTFMVILDTLPSFRAIGAIRRIKRLLYSFFSFKYDFFHPLFAILSFSEA